MRLLEVISLVTLAALAAGCTSTGGVTRPNVPETVSSEKALALPPPGGPAVVSVVERNRGKDVEQTISLFTSSSVPGQNFLKVQFLGVSGPNPALGTSPYKMIGDYTISREMSAAIPGVRLARSATFLQNSYGPFGYASGRSRAGDTCIYGWQQIRASRPNQAQYSNFSAVQVRLRLCDARATERQLLSVMYGYTVVGAFKGEGLTPFGAPQGADGVLGATGAPIYPDVGAYRNGPMPIGFEPAPAAVRPVSTVRRTTVRPVATEAPPILPQPVGPRVPLPNQVGNVPSDAGAAPTQYQPEPTRATNITVPTPDCTGAAATTAACRK